MGTDIRAEISTKSKYWVSKHRYYELKHFCLQYPEWKKNYASFDGFASHSPTMSESSNSGSVSNPTAVYAEARLYFYDRMRLVERVADEAAEYLAPLLLRAIIENVSYEHLRAQVGVPCCKDTWYTVYRRFFLMLDKARQ